MTDYGPDNPRHYLTPEHRAELSRLNLAQVKTFGKDPAAWKAARDQHAKLWGPAKAAADAWNTANPAPAAPTAPAPARPSYQPPPKRQPKPFQYPSGLNPVQFEGHLYHGTRFTYKKNQILTGEEAAKYNSNGIEASEHGLVFAADTPQKAALFAKSANRYHPERSGMPDNRAKVYRLEALERQPGDFKRDQFHDPGPGDPHYDPGEPGEWAEHGKSYQGPAFRVLGEYTGKHRPLPYE